MAKPRTRKTSTDKTSEAAIDPVEITSVDEAPAQAEVSGADSVPASPFEEADPVVLDAPSDPTSPTDETPDVMTPEVDPALVADLSSEEPTAPQTEDVLVVEEPVEASDKIEAEKTAVKPEAPVQGPVRPVAPAKKSGFFPIFLGGVVAAGLGAGAAIYALPQIPAQYLPQSLQPAAPAQDPAQAEALAAQTARVDALEAKIAALPAPAAAADTSALETALVDADAKIAALTAQVTSVESQMAALGDRALESDPAAAAAMEQVQGEIAQMKALIEEGRNSSDAAKAQIEAAAEEAAARISGAEAEAANLRAAAQADADKARGRAAVAQLGVAIASGVGTAEALAAVAETGVQIPPALSADVPSLAALKDSFDAPARKALAASRKAVAGDGALDKIGAFLIAQTGVRSLEAQEGDDPDAVLSRAGVAVTGGALQAALDEIAKLPTEGQEAMAAWVANAQSHIAATDALGQLAQSLN